MARPNKRRRFAGRFHGENGQRRLCVGHQHRMRMVSAGPDKWRRREGADAKKGAWDSMVHRCGREIGFLSQDSTAELEEHEAAHPRFQETREHVNSVQHKPKKHEARARAQSNFECFLQATFPEDLHTQCLNGLQNTTETHHANNSTVPIQKKLEPPRESLILSCMKCLRDEVPVGRNLKHLTIKLEVDLLSCVLIEFSHSKGPNRTAEIKKPPENYEEQDNIARAVAFDPEVFLPQAWEQLWRKSNLSHTKKVQMWSRLLGQMAIVGRASDISEHCPSTSTTTLPPTTSNTNWLKDGTPRHLDVVFDSWKGRKQTNVGNPHHVRICHNPKSLKCDPVTWTLKEWRCRGANEMSKRGAPLFFPVTEKTWNEQLRDHVCGPLGPPHTSHSIRHSAAQWAARCGADIAVIRNVGRWESLADLLKCVAEGNERNRLASEDSQDPIYEFWPFFPKTSVTALATATEQAKAMRSRGARVTFT